ncbi:hypothetical protein OG984_29135 [Nocardioides sp. NBC_00368]|uniref:hypothetical protein n=1 Tax=Nocardioides sp. NBC_00368 TaxID=2976000 RepID=UPI002E1AC665
MFALTQGCSSDSQARDDSQVKTDGTDDHCDQDLHLDTATYEASDLNEAVSLADVILEAKVLDVTTDEQEPTDDSKLSSVSYTATIKAIRTLKGTPPSDPWSSHFSSDFLERTSGEVVERIGDHDRAALTAGNHVLIFVTVTGSGSFAIQPPGPLVVTDDVAHMTPCGVRSADRVAASSLSDLDGMQIAEVRSKIQAELP